MNVEQRRTGDLPNVTRRTDHPIFREAVETTNEPRYLPYNLPVNRAADQAEGAYLRVFPRKGSPFDAVLVGFEPSVFQRDNTAAVVKVINAGKNTSVIPGGTLRLGSGTTTARHETGPKATKASGVLPQ